MSYLTSEDVSTGDKRKNNKRHFTSSVRVNLTLQGLSAVRFSSETCDGFICTEDGGRLPFHKAVLCSCSDYFRALFCGLLAAGSRTKQSRDVILPRTATASVAALLGYIYTGKLSLTMSEVESVLILADWLIIPHAAKACEKFLVARLAVYNCFRFYNLSKKCYCPYLQDRARQFILRHLLQKTWYCNEDFAKLSAEELYTFLSDDDLNTRSEEHVLNIILKWIEIDEASRKQHLPLLIKAVRLGLCRQRYLLSMAKNNHLISEDITVVDVLKHVAYSQLIESVGQISISKTEAHLFRQRNPSSLLLVIGGWMRSGVTSRMEIYNPKTSKWIISKYNDAPYPRAYHGVVKLDHFVYCLGGYDGSRCLSTVRRFDLQRREWTSVASMHIIRCYGAFAAANDSTILAAGGYDGRHRTNHCELYDAKSNTWSVIAPMKQKRSDASASNSRVSEIVFVAGGYDGYKVLSSVEMYRTKENDWTDVSPMCNPRSGFRLLRNHSYLLAVGGFNGLKRLRSVECCDLHTGMWSVASKMRLSRSNFMAAIADDYLYVAGGYHAGEMTEHSVEAVYLTKYRRPKKSREMWYSLPSIKGQRSAHDGCSVSTDIISSLLYNEDCPVTENE